MRTAIVTYQKVSELSNHDAAMLLPPFGHLVDDGIEALPVLSPTHAEVHSPRVQIRPS